MLTYLIKKQQHLIRHSNCGHPHCKENKNKEFESKIKKQYFSFNNQIKCDNLKDMKEYIPSARLVSKPKIVTIISPQSARIEAINPAQTITIKNPYRFCITISQN